MKTIQIVAAVASGLLVYLLLTGGHTWQLVPLEVIATFLLWQVFQNPQMKRAGWIYFISVWGVGLTLLALYIMPRFQLPKPTGPFAIGVTYAAIETNRPETFTTDTTDKRTLYLKIWYPAANTSTERNPYLEGGKQGIATLAELANLPGFLFSHFSRIRTHGFTNAPLAERLFPILTFSHGYGSWFGQNTALMEELASRGFVVIAIAHSHQTIIAARDENTLVQFERVVPLDTNRPADDNKRFEDFLATADRAKFTELFYQHLAEAAPFTHTCAQIWGDDIRSALDYITTENERLNSMFFHHLDTQKVGAFGMSFGGAASGQAALHDPRIKAGLNMDGTPYGTWAQDTMRIPFLTLEAKRSRIGYSMYAPLRARSKGGYLNLLFVDAEHYNFTDVNLFSPIFQWLGVTGKVSGDQMMTHLCTIVPDFFTRVFAGDQPVESDYVVPDEVERAEF
jgi:pimeloyl-ACP methyl ester carboxylesterase